jgi:hypothetical protein
MKARELVAELEKFRSALATHQRLWGSSLDDFLPDYAVSLRRAA